MPASLEIDPVLATIACVSGILILLLFMRPRRFYLIRHGETLLNAQHIRQGETGELSERGREQAVMIGKYLRPLRIARIVSSAYPRALETAAIINANLHVPIIPSLLFTERRNPSEIIGKNTRDPEVIRIVDQMDLAYHDDDYLFSDEETFSELKKRARTCLALLAQQGRDGTIIITHHHILKMIVAYLLYRERLHASDFVKLSFFNISDNAGITIIEFHPWQLFSPARGWRVISFNEHLTLS